MVVILQRETTHPRKPYRGIQRTSSKDSPARIFVVARQQRAVPLYAEKLFGIQKVLALRGWVFSPVERLSNPKLWILTKKEHSSPKLRVTSILFRLNEEQNIRFNDLLCKAGLEHNRSRFIVKRIFGEEFVVVRRDPSKVQFVARLNDFYFQFQKLANNCAPVKAI